jgi:hypothetical protein
MEKKMFFLVPLGGVIGHCTHTQGQSLQTTLNPGFLALLTRYCSIGSKSSRWNLPVPLPFSSLAHH